MFVKIFCTTQTYTWRGKFFLQLVGLPIGPRATSAIARIVMNCLDAMFLKKMEAWQLEMVLKMRYIDDVRIAMARIMAGVRVVGSNLVVDEHGNLHTSFV